MERIRKDDKSLVNKNNYLKTENDITAYEPPIPNGNKSGTAWARRKHTNET